MAIVEVNPGAAPTIIPDITEPISKKRLEELVILIMASINKFIFIRKRPRLSLYIWVKN